MNILNVAFALSPLILSIFLYKFINKPLINICEVEKCPYCFETDFCAEFERNKLVLRTDSIYYLFINFCSVKNVLFAFYNDRNVVLKKLGHNFELNRLDKQIHTNNRNSLNLSDDLTKIIEFLSVTNINEVRNFKICAVSAIKKFISLIAHRSANVSREVFLKNLWFTLQLNAEPLLIQILLPKDNWPVPYYFGACGRVIVEDYCGSNLNDFSKAIWNVRAHLALQLLEAATNFTEKHPDFRIYLTDISPDNIAVSSDFKITYVDLENAIITSKDVAGRNIHRSASIHTKDTYAFSEIEICESSISDHNYYAVFKLLLSKDAPWPMMEGGLLHSPPYSVLKFYPILFEVIEMCAHDVGETDCFKAVKIATDILRKILV